MIMKKTTKKTKTKTKKNQKFDKWIVYTTKLVKGKRKSERHKINISNGNILMKDNEQLNKPKSEETKLKISLALKNNKIILL